MKPSSHISISLNDPCHEKAENMTATSCGMYCHVCNKEVIDFSRLTDVELVDMIRKYPTGCGSFRKEQLNTVYGIPDPNTKKPLRIWAGILTLISLLSIKEADAQTQGKTKVSVSKVDSTNNSPKKDTAINNKRVLTKAEIEVLPTTNVSNLVSVTTGGYKSENRHGELNLAGCRGGTTYIIDGVPVKADGTCSPPPKENILRRAWRSFKSMF